VDPALKGLHWCCLRTEASSPNCARVAYCERWSDILDSKQVVVSSIPQQSCTNVLRSQVDPLKDVAIMILVISKASSPGPAPVRPMAFTQAINGLLSGRQTQGAWVHLLSKR
jgi:hypothetical protein